MHRNKKPMQLLAHAQHGQRDGSRAPDDGTTTSRTSRNVAAIQLTPSQFLQILSWLFRTSLWFWQSCYAQLTPIKTRYPLTSIALPCRRLRFIAHLSWPLIKYLFSIESLARIRLGLGCLERVVLKAGKPECRNAGRPEIKTRKS